MGKIAAMALIPVLALGGVVAATPILMVDVQEAGGPRIVVPAPGPLVRAALAFAPEEARRVHAPELSRWLPHAERILEELEKAPDGVLVEVQDGEDRVRIWTEGELLRVRVREGDHSATDVRLPLRSAGAMLRAYDAEAETFRTVDMMSALYDAPRGDLVRARDGGDRVRVRMW